MKILLQSAILNLPSTNKRNQQHCSEASYNQHALKPRTTSFLLIKTLSGKIRENVKKKKKVAKIDIPS